MIEPDDLRERADPPLRAGREQGPQLRRAAATRSRRSSAPLPQSSSVKPGPSSSAHACGPPSKPTSKALRRCLGWPWASGSCQWTEGGRRSRRCPRPPRRGRCPAPGSPRPPAGPRPGGRRRSAGEAVGVQLLFDRQREVGLQPVLDQVAPLVADDEADGGIADVGVEGDHQARLVPGDDVVAAAVEGVLGSQGLAAALRSPLQPGRRGSRRSGASTRRRTPRAASRSSTRRAAGRCPRRRLVFAVADALRAFAGRGLGGRGRPRSRRRRRRANRPSSPHPVRARHASPSRQKQGLPYARAASSSTRRCYRPGGSGRGRATRSRCPTASGGTPAFRCGT